MIVAATHQRFDSMPSSGDITIRPMVVHTPTMAEANSDHMSTFLLLISTASSTELLRAKEASGPFTRTSDALTGRFGTGRADAAKRPRLNGSLLARAAMANGQRIDAPRAWAEDCFTTIAACGGFALFKVHFKSPFSRHVTVER